MHLPRFLAVVVSQIWQVASSMNQYSTPPFCIQPDDYVHPCTQHTHRMQTIGANDQYRSQKILFLKHKPNCGTSLSKLYKQAQIFKSVC